MYLCRDVKISEQKAERRILIRMAEGLHRRPWIRQAELDTRIQAFAVKLLDHEVSSDDQCRSIKRPAVTSRR